MQVTGAVSGSTGSLILTIRDPAVNQTGEFSCEANAVNEHGHVVTFTSSVEVTTSTPSMTDLIVFVKELSAKNEGLENKVEDLEQTVSRLQNTSRAMVFFNAKIKGNPHYPIGLDVIFNNVRDNKGNNYNGVNGLFTCKVPGYYHFSLGWLSEAEKSVGVQLYHNAQVVFSMYAASGHSYQAASNSATLQLLRGDVVKIRTYFDSTIHGDFCSFSGHLIEAV